MAETKNAAKVKEQHDVKASKPELKCNQQDGHSSSEELGERKKRKN